MHSIETTSITEINETDRINQFLIISGLGFIFYFLYFWLFTPSWIHYEFTKTAPRYLLSPEQGFFSNFMNHVFNLRITEGGLYRPRILCFIIQYIDTNLSFQLFKSYPEFGIKLPSYGFAIIATVASFLYFWKTLFKNSGYGIALIGGASLLYFDSFLNTSFMVLRGAKFLIPAVGLFCVSIFLRTSQHQFSWKQSFYCMLMACLIFILSMLDEQIVCFVFFITFCAMLLSIKEKKSNQAFIIFTTSAVLYVFYYFYLGRILFDTFTPGGILTAHHPHQYKDVLRLNHNAIYYSIQMLGYNLSLLGIALWILAGIFFVSLIHIQQKKIPMNNKLIALFLFTFPILLTSIMITSHPSIYRIGVLWEIFYLPFPVFLLVLCIIYTVYLADFNSKIVNNTLAIIFSIICISGVYRIDSLYGKSCEVISKVLNRTNGLVCGDYSIFSNHFTEQADTVIAESKR
ncbi:MAG: hypothetical protein WC627_10735 [Legionella sp.]|jgi:hypothetical protein